MSNFNNTNATGGALPSVQQGAQPTFGQRPAAGTTTTGGLFGGATAAAASCGATAAPASGGLFGGSKHGHDPRTSVPRYIDARDTIIDVNVGDPAVTFHVHRSILLRSSEFLQTKAKPEWSKGEATVDLPGHPSVAFEIYSKWLYTGSIVSRLSLGLFGAVIQEDPEWPSLAHAFVLGEELMDTEFKSTIMDALRAKAQDYRGDSIWPVSANVVRIIYDGTPSGSPARRFIVDIYHNHADETALDSTDGFPADFLRELSRTSLSRRTKTKMTEPAACYTMSCVYHEHGKDGKCHVIGKPWRTE